MFAGPRRPCANPDTRPIGQGGFQAFPIQEDDHLRTALRYVERNPLHAGLVERAEAWPWSSLRHPHEAGRMPGLDTGPAPRGETWLAYVNQPQTEAELERLRRSVQRRTPYGAEPRVRAAADRLGLEFTLHPARGGRPRKRHSQGAAGAAGLWAP
jgi:putative transposase